MEKTPGLITFEGGVATDNPITKRLVKDLENLAPVGAGPGLTLRDGITPYAQLTPVGVTSGLVIWLVQLLDRVGTNLVAWQRASDSKVTKILEYTEQRGTSVGPQTTVDTAIIPLWTALSGSRSASFSSNGDVWTLTNNSKIVTVSVAKLAATVGASLFYYADAYSDPYTSVFMGVVASISDDGMTLTLVDPYTGVSQAVTNDSSNLGGKFVSIGVIYYLVTMWSPVTGHVIYYYVASRNRTDEEGNAGSDSTHEFQRISKDLMVRYDFNQINSGATPGRVRIHVYRMQDFFISGPAYYQATLASDANVTAEFSEISVSNRASGGGPSTPSGLYWAWGDKFYVADDDALSGLQKKILFYSFNPSAGTYLGVHEWDLPLNGGTSNNFASFQYIFSPPDASGYVYAAAWSLSGSTYRYDIYKVNPDTGAVVSSKNITTQTGTTNKFAFGGIGLVPILGGGLLVTTIGGGTTATYKMAADLSTITALTNGATVADFPIAEFGVKGDCAYALSSSLTLQKITGIAAGTLTFSTITMASAPSLANPSYPRNRFRLSDAQVAFYLTEPDLILVVNLADGTDTSYSAADFYGGEAYEASNPMTGGARYGFGFDPTFWYRQNMGGLPTGF